MDTQIAQLFAFSSFLCIYSLILNKTQYSFSIIPFLEGLAGVSTCEPSILLILSAITNHVQCLKSNEHLIVGVHFDDSNYQVHVCLWLWLALPVSLHSPAESEYFCASGMSDIQSRSDTGDVSPPSLRADFPPVRGVPLLVLTLLCLMWKTGAFCLMGDDVTALCLMEEDTTGCLLVGLAVSHARHLPRWPIFPG